jgi:hypothetical protein
MFVDLFSLALLTVIPLLAGLWFIDAAIRRRNARRAVQRGFEVKMKPTPERDESSRRE